MTEHYNIKSITSQRRELRHLMPKAEVILWKSLLRKQMMGYKFRRQYSIDKYVIDFYCPELKLAVEVDGDSHYVDNAEEYDNQGQEYIKQFGVKFLRVTNNDVYKNLDGVLTTISDRIEVMKGSKGTSPISAPLPPLCLPLSQGESRRGGRKRRGGEVSKQ
jgi:very-short-patch-repair endonuclease